MESSNIITWQKKLLPFMVWAIIALIAFFLIATLIQSFVLYNLIETPPQLDINESINNINQNKLEKIEPLEYLKWKALINLESHTLQRRYHQANVSLMYRSWVGYLGFLTGMILAIVGAIFILGKLKETETKVDAESSALWKLSISSSSPGLILAFLGTILMITTMVSHQTIDVTDSPIYLKTCVNESALKSQISSPPSLGEKAKDIKMNDKVSPDNVKTGIKRNL